MPRAVLVDTSTWIAYFRRGDDRLRRLLVEARAVVHPWVLYELELGSGIPVEDRRLLASLPRVETLSDEEAWRAAAPLRGSGVGWVDAHLLASAQAAELGLLTRDAPLLRAARRLGVAVAG